MFISKFDLLTPPIGLHFRGKGSHSSIFSGIITLLAYLIIIYFAFRYSLDYIKKKKPTAYYVNRILKMLAYIRLILLLFFIIYF